MRFLAGLNSSCNHYDEFVLRDIKSVWQKNNGAISVEGHIQAACRLYGIEATLVNGKRNAR